MNHAEVSDSRNRRWTVGVALAAALIGLAPAARADTDLDPFEDLFGSSGINTWTASADNALGAAAALASTQASTTSSLVCPEVMTRSPSWLATSTRARLAAFLLDLASLLTPLGISLWAWITRSSPAASRQRWTRPSAASTGWSLCSLVVFPALSSASPCSNHRIDDRPPAVRGPRSLMNGYRIGG